MITSASSNLEIGARAMSCVIWKMLLYLTIEYFIECSRKKVCIRKIADNTQEGWLERKMKEQLNKMK